jgi:flagellar biosynthesis/type III secretory pathway chaperone
MDSIATITQGEIELISRFISLLMEERGALKTANIAALPEIAARKLQLIDQLNAVELTRSQLLDCPESKHIRQAMTHWLTNHPGEKATASNWKKVLELALQAKQAHELNSRLINMHLQQNSEMLAILTRQTQRSSLYGSDGQTSLTTGNRIIDSA